MGQKIIGASSKAVQSSMVIQNSHGEALQCSRPQNVTLNNTTLRGYNLKYDPYALSVIIQQYTD